MLLLKRLISTGAKDSVKNRLWCTLLIWNKKNIPPLDEEELSAKVNSMYERYDKLPVKYYEKDGSYFKQVSNGKKVRKTQLDNIYYTAAGTVDSSKQWLLRVLSNDKYGVNPIIIFISRIQIGIAGENY